MGTSGSTVRSRAVSCIDLSEDLGYGFHDNYLVGPKLGRGAFAEVFAAIQIKHDATRSFNQEAVKVSFFTTEKQQTASRLEEELWLAVSHHDNCVRLHNVFRGDGLCYMVMERCHCSLFNHIKGMTDLTELALGHIFWQMLQSLSHVHSAHVVHRDVKPDNFLVGGENGQTVKLCDFGLSSKMPRTRKLSDIVGTAPYMCPEMLRGEDYDCKSDVWSLGVLAYAFLFGIFPYMPKTRSSKLMKLAIIEGISPGFEPVSTCVGSGARFRSDAAVEFVKSLLKRDAEQRPTAMEALNMDYMSSIVDKSHAALDEFPSLLPMLSSAREAGVFETQDVFKEVEIDILLNALQMEKHGTPVFKRRSSSVNFVRKGSSLHDMSTKSTICPNDMASRVSLLSSTASSMISSEASVANSSVNAYPSSSMYNLDSGGDEEHCQGEQPSQ